ncbi:MAG TPA: ABC transporter permease subunit [Bauldia sp.]|nr:ABC transporter permease subunit [Bauldia sp.]
MKSNRSAVVLLAPALVALSFLLLAPLLNVALESIRQYVPGRAGSVPGAPLTAENYLEFLHPAYLLYFYDTFRISLIATVLGIAVGLPVAHLVARRGSGVVRRLWVGFLVAMMFLSVLVRVYSIQLTLGPVGLLRIVGSLTGVNTNSPVFAEALIVAGLMHYVIPIAALTLIGPIQNIDPRLVEAALAVGASRVAAHRTGTLPLAVPGILSAFLIPMILGKGQIFFVSNLIYSRFQETANYPSGSALAIIMLAVSLLVILAVTRLARARWAR